MPTPDVNAIVQRMIEATRGFVARAEAKIGKRVDDLEQRLAEIPAGPRGAQGDRGERGEPGVAAYELAVERGYAGTELQWLESLRGPAGQDGKSVAGQPGERGDPGPAGESIRGEVGPHGPQGDAGERGSDGAIGERGPAGERGEIGPPGKPGESVHQDTLHRMVAEQVAAAVAQIPQSDGRDGRDALELEILPGIDESKSYPRGTFAEYRGGMIRAIRNTDPIIDGLDKAGWTVSMNGVAEESEETLDEGRTIRRKTVYTNGRELVRESKTSVMLYREVWREGEYEKGDGVTWDGSCWIAQRKTSDKPGTSDAFRLAVKRGKDGKDADLEPPKSLGPVRLK